MPTPMYPWPGPGSVQSCRLLLIAGLLCASLLAGCERQPAPQQVSAGPASVEGTVTLIIQFGGQPADKSVEVPSPSQSTALSILQAAAEMGLIEFEFRGEGDTAFVTSIDGVQNQLAAGDNWVFRINDQLADRSSGVVLVNPGDRIHWTFGKYAVD